MLSVLRLQQDFNAAGLKHKKHWHSFTAPGYFLPLEEVMQGLETKGKLFIDRAACEALLKGPLRCHRCDAAQDDMPALKRHIRSCAHPANAADSI